MSPPSSHPPAAGPVIEATGLGRRFGARWAFTHVDLTVQPGERLLIVGANGSGKTTLLRVLSTILTPTVGQLRLFGGRPVHAARRELALLSHHVGLYEDLSGLDNLGVLARILDRRGPDPRALLRRVGLEPDRPDPVRAFSAGMRKRLQLAALLLQQPALVFLDEPFAALDPQGCADTAAIIGELEGAVLIASHQLSRAAAVCEGALLMHAGQPRWQGPAAQVSRAWSQLEAQAEGAA